MVVLVLSRPAWGAWIEITQNAIQRYDSITSRPAWGAWIEMPSDKLIAAISMSRPAWGAWIEIHHGRLADLGDAVAPLAGRVD